MSPGSIAISHFIPDVCNYCPLSFFFFKKNIFREPAFLYCFYVFKSMTDAPILFPVPFVLGEAGGISCFFLCFLEVGAYLLIFRLPTPCFFESIYYYTFPSHGCFSCLTSFNILCFFSLSIMYFFLFKKLS